MIAPPHLGEREKKFIMRQFVDRFMIPVVLGTESVLASRSAPTQVTYRSTDRLFATNTRSFHDK
jgi:hypothetical protein